MAAAAIGPGIRVAAIRAGGKCPQQDTLGKMKVAVVVYRGAAPPD